MRQLAPQRSQPTVWDFMNDVERLFDDSWTTERGNVNNAFSLPFQPKIDVKETEHNYLIAADLPGMTRNQIKIRVENGRLVLSGERFEEKMDEDATPQRLERIFGRFERSFQLPSGIDEDLIQARLEDGVLEVLVPKPQIAKTKAVTIDGEKKGLFSKLLSSNTKKDHKNERNEEHH